MDSSSIPPVYVAWMRIVVSLVTLLFAFLIITAPHFVFSHPFDEGMQKLAAGWIGVVIGYWLS
jgi:hypothetical protein